MAVDDQVAAKDRCRSEQWLASYRASLKDVRAHIALRRDQLERANEQARDLVNVIADITEAIRRDR